MDEMPVKLITHPQPGLYGAAAAFAKEHRMTIDEIMRAAPVIPVLVLDGDDDWARLAETFVGAGLPVLEITLAHAAGARRDPADEPGARRDRRRRDGAQRGAAGPGDRCRQPASSSRRA